MINIVFCIRSSLEVNEVMSRPFRSGPAEWIRCVIGREKADGRRGHSTARCDTGRAKRRIVAINVDSVDGRRSDEHEKRNRSRSGGFYRMVPSTRSPTDGGTRRTKIGTKWKDIKYFIAILLSDKSLGKTDCEIMGTKKMDDFMTILHVQQYCLRVSGGW